jgi:hypothetical protein
MTKLPLNQRNTVLKLFLNGEKHSSITALKAAGTTRLAALVHFWNKRGYQFKREYKTFKTRQGVHGCYVEYSLDRKATSKDLLKVKFSF